MEETHAAGVGGGGMLSPPSMCSPPEALEREPSEPVCLGFVDASHVENVKAAVSIMGHRPWIQPPAPPPFP